MVVTEDCRLQERADRQAGTQRMPAEVHRGETKRRAPVDARTPGRQDTRTPGRQDATGGQEKKREKRNLEK